MAPSRHSGLRGRLAVIHVLFAALRALLPALLPVLLLAPSLVPPVVLGADGASGTGWTKPRRVTAQPGSRLDSLHQLAASGEALLLLHSRIGPRQRDDRVVLQRSKDAGKRWSPERTLFAATKRHRHVVSNLAIAARRRTVVVAWRVRGPDGTTLFARTSTDGGTRFGRRVELASTAHAAGLGVPVAAVGKDFVSVAWTERDRGRVKVRTSRDGGRTYRSADTLGRSRLSIECRSRVLDGLVGMTASGSRLHVAWSKVRDGGCLADSIDIRTSPDRGGRWSATRTITRRRSYGWPELDARGRTVLATVQLPSGGLLVARSARDGRRWHSQVLEPRKGRYLGSGDVVLIKGSRGIHMDQIVSELEVSD